MTDVHYYGKRFYDPGSSRWISKDPAGEHYSRNLYCFVKNDAVRRFDLIGLTDGLTYCQAVKRFWDSASPIQGGQYARIWPSLQHALADRTIGIECKDCGCNANGQPRCASNAYLVNNVVYKVCRVEICANGCGDEGLQGMVGRLVHELTHCVQLYNGHDETGCSACLCAELQALHNQFPADPITDPTHISMAKASCQSGDIGNSQCRAGEADRFLQGLGSQAQSFFQRCASTGVYP